MRRYVFIKADGSIDSMMQWADERDLPEDYPIPEGTQVVETDQDVSLWHTYNFTDKQFYILDISDNEVKLTQLQAQLEELEGILSQWQEDTWAALGVDITKLPQYWQDILTQKNDIRAQIKQLQP